MHASIVFALLVVVSGVLYAARAIVSTARDPSSSKPARSSSEATERKIGRTEIAKHSALDDLWIIIDGKVYDVTNYVDEHPGGARAIAKNAGGDATKGFKGPQHPSRVFDIVEEYLIGVVDEGSSSNREGWVFSL